MPYLSYCWVPKRKLVKKVRNTKKVIVRLPFACAKCFIGTEKTSSSDKNLNSKIAFFQKVMDKKEQYGLSNCIQDDPTEQN